MSFILKIMGTESAPDSDTRKTFQLIECDNVQFFRTSVGNAFAQVYLPDDGPQVYDLDGCNTYVMNYDGKTVATFGSGQIPEVNYAADAHQEKCCKVHGYDPDQEEADRLKRWAGTGPNGSTPAVPHAVLPAAYSEAADKEAAIFAPVHNSSGPLEDERRARARQIVG